MYLTERQAEAERQFSNISFREKYQPQFVDFLQSDTEKQGEYFNRPIFHFYWLIRNLKNFFQRFKTNFLCRVNF